MVNDTIKESQMTQDNQIKAKNEQEAISKERKSNTTKEKKIHEATQRNVRASLTSIKTEVLFNAAHGRNTLEKGLQGNGVK